MIKENLILIGGGGHCKSVIDVIELENKYKIIGVLDKNISIGTRILDYEIIGRDEDISNYSKFNDIKFLITVGQIKSYAVRLEIGKKLEENNCKIASIVSPRAYISKYSKVGKGTVVMHDAFVNVNATVGIHCILNTNANVEHDSTIGDFCHISTGVIVNGDCTIEKGCFLGSNSTISNGKRVIKNSVITAGTFYK